MKNTKELLAKQMTRKEFLQIIGVGILTVFGVSNFLSLLGSRSQPTVRSREVASNDSSRGFGSRKFGM